jgi:hypothetical protein
VLDPPDPAGTVTGVATTVGTVATGEVDSAGATVLTTFGADASSPPAADDSAGEAVVETWAGLASEAAGVEFLTAGAGVELSTEAADVAGVELSTGAAGEAGVVEPPVTGTPHAPRGLLPGNSSSVPKIVSSIGHWMLQEVDGSLIPPIRPGHLSIPASPALQLSMICFRVGSSHPEI